MSFEIYGDLPAHRAWVENGLAHQAEKVLEEAEELLEEARRIPVDHERVLEEAADVLVALCGVFYPYGTDRTNKAIRDVTDKNDERGYLL